MTLLPLTDAPPSTSSTTDEPTRPNGADEVTWHLHVTYHRTHDPDVLDQLVQVYLAYARRLARQWTRGCHSPDDLQQVACEGLLTALVRFDPQRGLPFYAFARPTITGALKRHYRDQGWAMRVPRSVHDVAVHRNEAEQRLTGRLHREPTVGELAAEIGTTPELVQAALVGDAARTTVSVDQLGEGLATARAGGPRGGFVEDLVDRMDLRRALDDLSSRDRWLLRRYFVDGGTQTEIACDLGVSQMQVSRMLTSVLARLRSQMAAA
jgi:RNA polymerase sigma-B factor